MRLPRNLVAFVAAAVLGGVAASAAAERPQTLTVLPEARPAPDLTLTIAEGGKLKLSSLRGKVVVVNFWASWCPPCKLEMPSLERLHLLMKGERLEIIAINAGESEDEIATFKAFAEPPPTFRLALDLKGDAMNAFSVKGLPATFVIDRQGKIVMRALGARQFDDPGIVATLKALAVK